MKKKEVLITWHSKNHDSDVLNSCMEKLKEKKINISTVIYLCQNKTDTHTLNKISVHLKPIIMEMYNPTEHKRIYTLLKKNLLPVLNEYRDVQFHINVSPGTPAMHAVWLLLFAGGVFPPDTRVWSSQKVRETGEIRLDAVDFSINTYLGEIRKGSYMEPGVARYSGEYQSPLLKNMLEKLRLYSSLPNAPFLILGERGTGKTRLVETIIKDIKGKEVISIPCGTLVPELAASELFGHVKGSFTGADTDKSGYIDNARDKILFLDEMQDLPKNVQRMLVRFLQDPKRRYRPLGCTHKVEKRSNTEVICASHLTLHELRQCIDRDFFDRIALLFFEVPPLRACSEDFESIWAEVWKEVNTSAEIKNSAPWNDRIKEALHAQFLPGNLRDFQRLALLIQAYMHSSSDPVRHAISVWKEMQKQVEDADAPGQSHTKINLTIPWDEQLNNLRHRMAAVAYNHYGSYKKAAEILKTNEKTIRNNIKTLKF